MKNKAEQSQTRGDQQDMTLKCGVVPRTLDWRLAQKKDINGKSDGTQIKSGVLVNNVTMSIS